MADYLGVLVTPLSRKILIPAQPGPTAVVPWKGTGRQTLLPPPDHFILGAICPKAGGKEVTMVPL